MPVQMTALCRKPDDTGAFNPRCQHVLEKPRGEETPRQCRAAAMKGTSLCGVHTRAKAT